MIFSLYSELSNIITRNSTRKDLATAKEEKYDVLELKMAELKSAQNDIMSLVSLLYLI